MWSIFYLFFQGQTYQVFCLFFSLFFVYSSSNEAINLFTSLECCCYCCPCKAIYHITHLPLSSYTMNKMNVSLSISYILHTCDAWWCYYKYIRIHRFFFLMMKTLCSTFYSLHLPFRSIVSQINENFENKQLIWGSCVWSRSKSFSYICNNKGFIILVWLGNCCFRCIFFPSYSPFSLHLFVWFTHDS